MSDPLPPFGKRIRLLRRQAELSQSGLARRAGMNVTHVARIERAEREPGIRSVIKLARGLGVPASKLFEGL